MGERCPACGRGRLYRLLPGVEMRLDGNALRSAVRYELEKLRCSACGQIFTAPLPVEAGVEKYSARGRCERWDGITWACRYIGWRAIKRWWACQYPMPPNGIR